MVVVCTGGEVRRAMSTVDPVDELVEKVIDFIDSESGELSLSEYREFLESLVDDLQSRIEAAKHDLEYTED